MKNYEITNEEATVIQVLVQKKPNCPVCDEPEFEIGRKLALIPVGPELADRSRHFAPMITVTCLMCGYHRFFAATLHGFDENSP